MPRPERPIDASAGPVQQFAAELRRLRQDAGGKPYRIMAAQVHFSRATLSSAARGHQLPTWEVVKAYVEACGGDIEHWYAEWLRVRTELGRPARFEDDVIDAEKSPVDESAAKWILNRRTWMIVAALLLGVVGMAFILRQWPASNFLSSEHTPSSSNETSAARYLGPSSPAIDGADPKESGCAYDPDVSTIDSVEINTNQRNLLGVAELRYSPKCGVVWGRFTPSDRLTFLKSATVTIVAERPKSATVGVPFTTEFDGQAVFGNILTVKDACARITVTVAAPTGSGSGTTDCKP